MPYELVTNAFKHGCEAGATVFRITLERTREALVLAVSDNGAGMPALANDRSASLGFKLISALSRQLGATMRFPAAGTPADFAIEIGNNLLSGRGLSRQAWRDVERRGSRQLLSPRSSKPVS